MSREQVIDVARLRELLAQATPGPWQSMNEYQWDTIIGDIDGPDDGDMHYELVSDITSNHDRSRANARLIVAAVNALPELLNAYDRLSMPAADVETGQRWRDDDVTITKADACAIGQRMQQLQARNAEHATKLTALLAGIAELEDYCRKDGDPSLREVARDMKTLLEGV